MLHGRHNDERVTPALPALSPPVVQHVISPVVHPKFGVSHTFRSNTMQGLSDNA